MKRSASADPKRRAEAVRRITELFLVGAASFRSDQVDLFDGILLGLVPHADREAWAGDFTALSGRWRT